MNRSLRDTLVTRFLDAWNSQEVWHATLRRPGGELTHEIDGMDLVVLRCGHVARNEVYFDRSVLRVT